nr:head-tail adaptor protein [Jannaschia sp. Os4]
MTLLRPSEVADGSGGVVRGWVEVCGLWGEVKLRSGGARGGEWGASERVRVRIATRALPEGHPNRPRPGDRMRDGMRLWSVDAVAPEDGRGAWLRLFASSISEDER